ncbi:MAG: substrate-binding domain-containing protein [Acidobacteriota bacterium]
MITVGRRQLLPLAILVCFVLPGMRCRAEEAQHKSFVMAITTSIQDSGLLASLAEGFGRDTGLVANATSVGSGRALQMAADGTVQLTLTHDPAAEQAFVRTGKTRSYRQFMKSDFVIVGPPDDPAHIGKAHSSAEAFQMIAATKSRFVSRDDRSGTNTRELQLWSAAGVDPSTNAHYQRLRQSMSGALRSASEMRGYTLTDLATFAELGPSLDLSILFRGDPALDNVYSVILVGRGNLTDEDRNAARFEQWLLSPRGKQVVENFRIKGQQQFFWVANRE